MYWLLAIILFASYYEPYDISNYDCEIIASGKIGFNTIPEGYYVIASPDVLYDVELNSNLILDDHNLIIDAKIGLKGLGLLRVHYREEGNTGKFKYSILGYSKESMFELDKSVRELILEDPERAIENNLLDIVRIIVKNGMGERVYRDFEPVTKIVIDSVTASCR